MLPSNEPARDVDIYSYTLVYKFQNSECVKE